MSSRWNIDVYDGNHEQFIMIGWNIDSVEAEMNSHRKLIPHMKPMQIPLVYVDEICKGDGGSSQCRFLEKKINSKHDTHICHKNTVKAQEINRKVSQTKDLWIYVQKDHSSRTMPMGNNCKGIQWIHPNVLQKYEGPTLVSCASILTILEFENILVECLKKAYEHTKTIIHQQSSTRNLSGPERLGIFCTSVRSELNLRSDKLQAEETRNSTVCMTRPENWESILTPRKFSYRYLNNKIVFADGEWTLNYDKLMELSKAAETGHRFVSDETTLQSECTASLLLVERSIPTLNSLAEQARRINLESDAVIANMISIYESLER